MLNVKDVTMLYSAIPRYLVNRGQSEVQWGRELEEYCTMRQLDHKNNLHKYEEERSKMV